MLTDQVLEKILGRLPSVRIGVVGDLFLDRYLDIDARLTEPSIETMLDAYQVVRVRASPGAAGTVINNLAALGVGQIVPVAVIGDDGEGYELGQALARLRVIEDRWIIRDGRRRTPTYTKPMLEEPDKQPRELNRLDIKNRTPTPHELEQRIFEGLNEIQSRVDALLVLDQVSEENCGVVTASVRAGLAELGGRRREFLMLADSRERIGLFRNVWLKPNEAEARAASGLSSAAGIEQVLTHLSTTCGRPIFCTQGERGISIADAALAPLSLKRIPGYPVSGPIDIVGAGDSTSAGIACAMAAGTTPEQAAAFGNLVASITIQQLGTTGTASPAQVRERWTKVSS